MAGHSKWSKIKRAKAANDAKRSKVFTRYLREIQVAAKTGGDVDGNPRLKRVIDTAKANGVPADNIERAVKRGTGDLEGVEYLEASYEAYGPGGVGLIITALTDNKNRTVGEIRHVLSKNNGNLASSNAVAYQFDQKAVFSVAKELSAEDDLMELVLDAGAEDIQEDDEFWEVYASPDQFDAVATALTGLDEGISGELRMVPQNTIKVAGDEADQVLSLMDALDDLDDVQDVFTNADLD